VQQLLVSGLATGSLYALMALSLVLVHKAMGRVNFAQGEIAMFSTFVSYVLLEKLMVSPLLALLVAIAFGAALSAVVERTVIRPILGRPEAHAVIVSVGVFLMLNAGAGWAFGADPQGYPSVIELPSIKVTSAAVISGPQVLVIVTTIVVVGLLVGLFRYTKLGMAMRASHQDSRAAGLMGVRVGFIYTITWVFAGVLAAVTGMLTAPMTGLSPQMMVPLLVNGLAAAVVGGFGSLPGAVVGGLLLGVAEALIGSYASLNYQVAGTFAAIILVLILRPQGLFATATGRRV
jgi:branched-chain amino acid transport system permease protein